MLNDTTKRKINSLRDILVGKVPDPKSQVEQITNALIYKYMDDMDQQAIAFGGKASFFMGEYQKYSWKKLMDPKLGGQDRMNLYTESLERMSRNKNLSPIFRDILKGAFLPYRSPETLNMFLHEIDGFSYDHSEDLGDAFEYLLAIMGSQGDAGQFRTPRHIIDFIVDVIDPKKNETILDPACGTAGFLISAYKHIKENNKEKSGASIIHDEMRTLHKNFTGYDISPEMVKLSRVNMFLHNFPEPKIFEYDSLSSDERWDDNFDVILANPPFMSPKGGIIPHKRFSVPANRAEVLFVDYIMNHLRPKGRAGIIVPEGIIFQSGNVYKQLRKNLVEDGLYAVVSLPSGVFAPYSGVKTSILMFNNELSKKSKEICFVKIENDGFDLGAQRREIQKNDLPEALEILDKWNKGEKVESKVAVYVEKSKIAEGGDYNLSSDFYKVGVDYSGVKWPIVKLGDVVEILDNKRKPITKSDRKFGQFPYYGATGILDYVDNFIFDERLVLIGEDGAKWNIGDRTAFIAEGKYWVNNHAHVVRPIRNKLIDAFLVSFLNSIDLSPFITGVTVPKLNQEKLRSIKIPLPPLEIQEQIVMELNGYAGIIAGAKQINQNWQPKINIDSEWQKVKLGEVVDVFNGSTPKRTKKLYWENGKIPWFTIDDMRKQGRFITSTEQKITEKGFKESSVKLLPKETVLLCCTASIGEYAFSEIELTTNQQFNGLVVKEKNKLSPKYLFWYASLLKKELERMSGKATFGFVAIGALKNFEIFLPPISIQEKIIKKIEAERNLVESAKKLIEIYEQKTRDTVANLWKS